MAVSYGSGSIHFTGLGSDTDFDTMITQLKQIESYQKNRFTLWQADWNKRITAFQQLNTAMLSLNSTLNSMNTMSKFLLKTSTSSNENIMTAVASGAAQNNSNKVQVNKLATNAAYTWEGSTFSSTSDKVNPTSSTQQFVYTYKGKTVKVAVGANATIQQFVNQINSDANNPGVRASLVKNGSEYVFQLQGQDTGASATLTIDPSSSQLLAIKPPTEQAIPSKYNSASEVVNSSGASKSFVYKYNGYDFTVDVPDGTTLEGLRDAINNDSTNQGSNKRVTASIIDAGGGTYALKLAPANTSDKVSLSSSSQVNTVFTTDGAASTGWDSLSRQAARSSSELRFDKASRSVNSSGSAQDFVWQDSKGTHTISIANGATLTELAAQINSSTGTSTRAEICKDKNGYYLQLTELDPNNKNAPEITAASSSLLAITNDSGSSANWTVETDSYTLHSQGFSGEDAVINYSTTSQDFKYSYNGKTYTVQLAAGAKLTDLVNAINSNTQDEGTGAANTLVKARVACDGENAYRLYLAPVNGSSDKAVTIAADSSSCLEIGPARAGWKNDGNTTTYGKQFSSSSDVINNSGSSQEFKFIDGSGTTHSISVPAGATLDWLVNEISTTTQATASTVTENGKLKLAISDSSGPVRIESSSSKLLEIAPGDTWSSSSVNKSISFGNFTDGDAVINSSGAAQNFILLYKDKQYSVTLDDGATLQDLVDAINSSEDFGANASDPAKQLVQASIEGTAGNQHFVLKGIDDSAQTPNIADGSSSALAIFRNSSTSSFKKEKNSVTEFTTSGGTANIVNSSGSTQKFTYTDGTTTGSIDVPDGCTLEQFISLINNNKQMPTVYASAEYTGPNQYTLRLSGKDASNPPVVSPASSRASGFAVQPPNSTFTEDSEVPVSIFTTPVNGTDVVNSTSKTQKFMVEYQGKNISFNVEPGETVDDLISKINNYSGGEIKANLFTDTDNKQYLQLWGTDPADTRPPQVSTTSSSELLINPPDISSGDWYIQMNSNAQVKLNDWPAGDEWIESESNSPTELIEGLTLNFKDVGTAQITVTTNDVGIKEQVVALVDALNSVRSLIKQLTAVDSSKSTEDIEDASSNFDAQYGSILTGNYGVQLLSSILKSNTASQAKGFQYQKTGSDGLLTGDLFTSLAHVGITTDAETNSPTFGLLVIDETKLDAAIAQDPQAVAELFAADNKASVDSSDFSFASYVSGTTQPGVYQFNYSVNSDGNILDPYVTYQGTKYKASYDSNTEELTILEGPGKGLAVAVNNLSEGSYTGTVTLKMGKVGELASLTKDMNGDKGILNILKTNYQQISDNIQSKIDREEERLIVWERTTRAKFARLEAVLTKYNSLNSQLESTIKQLSSSSS